MLERVGVGAESGRGHAYSVVRKRDESVKKQARRFAQPLGSRMKLTRHAVKLTRLMEGWGFGEEKR